jgi:hypothetical protein
VQLVEIIAAVEDACRSLRRASLDELARQVRHPFDPTESE